MPESPTNQGSAPASGPKRSRTLIWASIAGAVSVIALIAGTWMLISVLTSKPKPDTQTEQYRAAWASAMQKAGVEATLPPTPVEITSLSGEGSHSFEATFTAEEATALLRIYMYTFESAGQHASLIGPTIEFPSDGVLRVTSDVKTDGGQSASFQIEGPVTYNLSARLRSPGATSVSAEGFELTGTQAQQVTKLALDYANSYLVAAPNFTAVEARIVKDGVWVKGEAPNRIVNH